MNFRTLGKTGLKISEISLGTWQVGGKWGSDFSHTNAERILNEAIDAGINFIDTADVYSNGESEKAVGKVVRSRSEEIYVASKCGQQINPHISENYTPAILRKYVEDTLTRLGMERLDLIQLHCPPTDVYYRPEIFGLFDDLKAEGKIRNLGVSVEQIEQAIKAIQFDNVTSVQIIYNMFRQRPAELFFPMAAEKNIGVIVRVPLASGLLTGLYNQQTSFEEGDHRHFNREGKFFDKGETFSGIDYATGLEAVDELKALFPNKKNLAPHAIKWVLMNPHVSCVIPGASRPEQVHSNLSTLSLNDLTKVELEKINTIYERKIKGMVHQCW